MKLTTKTTLFPGGVKEQYERHLVFAPDAGVEKEVVNLYPDLTYQTIEGFGGAFTESAGYVFARMPQALQARLIDAYFGEDGLGYTMGRTHIDSCDFSLGHYEAASDETLRGFSIERMREYILPMLRRAQAARGKRLPIMVAPWSPPAFMKTNGERDHGGKLLARYSDLWAEYLCRYIAALREAGCDVRRMTMQNEPCAVQTWDSCLYTAEEERAFLRDHLRPALVRHGLGDVEIFLWDHNKERAFERARDVIDDSVRDIVDGVAFHWYSGDHFEALHLIGERYPGLKLAQTEACIEFLRFDRDDVLRNAQKYAHDLIGDLNGGMCAFYDWNLVLNHEGGPNHVGNFCDAPFLYHEDSAELEERPIYEYLKHFTRAFVPGARRIAVSRYADQVECAACVQPDGGIAAVLLNRTGEELLVNIRLSGQVVGFALPAQSITTAQIALHPEIAL